MGNKKVIPIVLMSVLGLAFIASGIGISILLNNQSVAPQDTAANSCPYVITKARAQKDVTQPWSENLIVNLTKDKSVKITTFQCTPTDGAACDFASTNAELTLSGAGFDPLEDKFTITGPDSIPTVPLREVGEITLTGYSPGFENDPNCSASTKIIVTGCPYVATKPVAKLASGGDWSSNLVVNKDKNPIINVTVFQCDASQGEDCKEIATDAVLSLNGAGFVQGSDIFQIDDPSDKPTINLKDTGKITLTASVPGNQAQDEPGCTATATVSVSKNPPPPAAPRPPAPPPAPRPRVLPRTGLSGSTWTIIGGGTLLVLGVITLLRYKKIFSKK